MTSKTQSFTRNASLIAISLAPLTPLLASESQTTNVIAASTIECKTSIGLSFDNQTTESYVTGPSIDAIKKVAAYGYAFGSGGTGNFVMGSKLNIDGIKLAKHPELIGSIGVTYPNVGTTSDGKTINLQTVITNVLIPNPSKPSTIDIGAQPGMATVNAIVKQEMRAVTEDGKPVNEPVHISFSDIDGSKDSQQTISIDSAIADTTTYGSSIQKENNGSTTSFYGTKWVSPGDAAGAISVGFPSSNNVSFVWGSGSGRALNSVNDNAVAPNWNAKNVDHNPSYADFMISLPPDQRRVLEAALKHGDYGPGYGSYIDANSGDKICIPNDGGKNITPPKNYTGSGNKTVDKNRIYRQGENGETFSYTLSGKLPIYDLKKITRHDRKTKPIYEDYWVDDSYWKNTNTNKIYYNKPSWILDKYLEYHSAGHWRTYIDHYVHDITPSSTRIGNKYLEHKDDYVDPASKNDSFTVTDNVPKEVSIQSIQSSVPSGVEVTRSGNTVTLKADQADLVTHSNGSWSLKISVKADNLPQPSASGFNDKFGNTGDYEIANQATITTYTSNSKTTKTTPKVTTKIQRVTGNIHHYDYDKGGNGDFGFLDEKAFNKNYQLKTNYNGDLQSGNEKVYGYVNDKKTVKVHKDLLKNNRYKYIFGYGDATSVNVYLNDTNTTNQKNKPTVTPNPMNFYLPYIVPRAKIVAAGLSIDTDTAENGLPYKLAVRGDSFLYREFANYNSTSITFNISSNGKQLASITRPLTTMTRYGHHAKYWSVFTGKLDVSGYKGSENWGKQIPIKVTTTINNAKSVEVDTHNVSSKAYIANRGTVTFNQDNDEKSFGVTNSNNETSVAVSGDTETITSPERTVHYTSWDDLGNPKDISATRILKEQLKVTQPRKATGKTGYGMTNQLAVTYKGALNPAKYAEPASDFQYAFPLAFNQRNSNISYHKDPLAIKEVRHNLKAHNFTDNDGNYIKNPATELAKDHLLTPLADQLNAKVDNSVSYNETLDINQSSKNQVSGLPSRFTDENKGGFKIKYSFFDRLVDHDNGNVTIANPTADKHAANNKEAASNAIDGGNRFFTPYWLPLGKYDTYFSTSYQSRDTASTKSTMRFGGNWFNIDENRPVAFYGHMYLAKDTESELADELSPQPILSDKQTPNSKNDPFTKSNFGKSSSGWKDLAK